MPKILKNILISILVLLIIFGGGFAYIYFANPFGIMNMYNTVKKIQKNVENPSNIIESSWLDLESLAENISPETENCLYQNFSEERINEVKAGAVPTFTEILKAKDCL